MHTTRRCGLTSKILYSLENTEDLRQVTWGSARQPDYMRWYSHNSWWFIGPASEQVCPEIPQHPLKNVDVVRPMLNIIMLFLFYLQFILLCLIIRNIHRDLTKSVLSLIHLSNKAPEKKRSGLVCFTL